MTPKNIELTRQEYNLIAKNRGIQEPQNMSTEELLNTLSRYGSKRKVKSNRRKSLKIKLEKFAKIQNFSTNELNKAEKLQNKSIDDLRRIARLRRIKNSDNLTKEDLIISLSKSESNPMERDDKVKGKINDSRIIVSRLGNIVTKNDRKKIKKELYEIEKKNNTFQIMKKKRFMIILSK